MNLIRASVALCTALILMVGVIAYAATPAQTYAAKCASCHAKDGRGNPAMAKVFKVEPALLSLVSEASQKHTDEELIKVTTNGLNKMPAYKGKLTEAQIKDLVAYIRSLTLK